MLESAGLSFNPRGHRRQSQIMGGELGKSDHQLPLVQGPWLLVCGGSSDVKRDQRQ